MDIRVVLLTLPFFLASAAAIYFLAKRGSVQMHPLLLNGSRLTLAGIVLLAISLLCGADFKLSAHNIVGYVLVAGLAIAIPQAMLFLALRENEVSETMAAFIEGCIPGMTFVFLMAARPISNPLPTLFCVVLALAGLAIFLGFNPFSSRFTMTKNMRLVILSAIITSIGLVIAGLVLPSSGGTIQEKLLGSVARTGITVFLAGAGSLAYALGVQRIPWETPNRSAVRYIVALAFIGSGMCWISLFLLLQEDIVVAASATIIVPVITALANWAAFGQRMNATQFRGAAVITISLIALIVIKLG